MCRKPITFSRSEVVNLGPGIAEQAIVDFVKQYETCDICGFKSNPNFNCENCSAYVCDSCLPCHKTLKSSHNVVPIIPRKNSCKIPMKITRTCMDHEDQPLDLFCIICRRILCIHCKEYSHTHCNKRIGLECQRYKRGFLNHFLKSSEDRQIRYQLNKLKRTVYVRDFANAARRWLKEVQIELKSCISFFQECETRFQSIGEQNSECHEDQQRRQKTINEIVSILHFGEEINRNIKMLLKETTLDAKVAETILDIEKDSLVIFRQRQIYAGCTLFVGIKTVTVKPNISNIKQSCRCVVTELPAKCASIMTLSYSSQLYATSYEKETVDEKLVNNLLSCTFITKRVPNSEMEKPGTRTGKSYWYITNCIANCLYPNRFLDNYELMNNGMPITERGRDMWVDEICTGYICYDNGRTAGSSIVPNDDFLGIRIHTQSHLCQLSVTSFVNLVSLPTYYCLRGNHLNTRKDYFPNGYSDKFVTHFAGNSKKGAGLQSIFLYTDVSEGNTNGNSFNKGMRGISINTNVAKLTKHINPINTFDGISIRQDDFVHEVIKDENNAFTVVKSTHRRSNNFLMYRSISAVEEVHNQFNRVLYNTQGNLFETAIPVTFFHTNLLCHLESGLYFAKKEDNGDITIGTITFSLKEIATNTVHTVRQSDTYIALCKLKPLTMVESTNKGIIVVCSVEDHNSELVMIRTDKDGPEAIEILEIDYSLSELSVFKESGDNDKNAAVDADSTDETVNAPTYTNVMTEDDFDDLGSAITVSNEVFTMAGNTDAEISEAALGSIFDATLADLEMDIDGNIMFLLERKDKNSYCVCTKYLMP